MRRLFVLLIGLISVSCADLHMGRSHLSEMERDDTPFFDAGRDFQVMAGDTGRSWRNDREIQDRTPASEEDTRQRRGERSLKVELSALENAQPEHAIKLYEKHRSKFGNVSERIYFLKLPYSERTEYLESRGFLDLAPKHSAAPHERMHAGRRSGVLLGMNKEDVRTSLGNPWQVEIAGNPSNENERWVYNHNGATRYIYFESGRVEGWE